MADYLEILIPELMSMIGDYASRLLDIDIIGIIVGIIFAFIIIRAIFRMVTG